MFELSETFTVWLPTKNGLSETVFDRHVIAAKHAFKSELFTDKNGNQAHSSAVLYFESDLPNLKSFVLKGDWPDLTPPQDAYEVKQFAKIPSYTNLKKVWL